MSTAAATSYPVQFSIDYPDRALSRPSTAFRLVLAVPIALLVEAVSGGRFVPSGGGNAFVYGAGGVLFLGPLLMILFRQKYPRWWFEWNLELQRFSNRVLVYLALMDDRYPSTDQGQSVHLDYPYPDPGSGLNRWLPLVKWLLAIPHLLLLVPLSVAAAAATCLAWFAILVTGRYPLGLFRFVEGVLRWWQRVTAYAFLLVTDAYPPFRLGT